MNQYISSQIVNMISATENFKAICKLSAMKDDGQISKEEEKLVHRINKAADSFIKELQKVKE